MHRRIRLGCALLLLVVVLLVGAAPASAEPQKAPQAAAVESVDLLGWVWDWLASLMADDTTGGTSNPGGGAANAWDGGAFIDPLGGNS